MGHIFKLKKCRSNAFKSGKPTLVKFFVLDQQGEEVEMSPLSEKGHKQLGQWVTFNASDSETFKYVNDKLVKKLKNLDSAQVAGEQKLKVYERYLLPSLRYFLAVHTLLKTNLDTMDTTVL